MDTSFYLGQPNKDFSYNLFSKDDFVKTELIEIDTLIPNQTTLDTECLKVKIKGLNLSIPHVLKYKGLNILIDGHHTVIAKKINGQKKVYCKTLIGIEQTP